MKLTYLSTFIKTQNLWRVSSITYVPTCCGYGERLQAQTSIIEIGQYWWNMQGRKAVVAIQRVLGHYVDTFSYYSPMAIRNDNEAYQHIAYSPIYPKFKVTDILRRNGFKDNFLWHRAYPAYSCIAYRQPCRNIVKSRSYRPLTLLSWQQENF